MPKQQTIQLPGHIYAAIMRRRFVWTEQARAEARCEALRLHCAQFGHAGGGATCTRCGMKVE